MNNTFGSILVKKPDYSYFDLSHDMKLSLKMDYLIPVLRMEVVPGDVVTISQQAMFRLMPMLSPIMHEVDIFFHNFYVPNRIIWENWETFITGGQDGTALGPVFPTLEGGTLSDQDISSLADYMGVPPNGGPMGSGYSSDQVSAIPFAAYQKIWYDYYRDQNLIDIPEVEVVDGAQTAPNTASMLTLRKRAWEHDYFTSALPFAQKGQPVQIPLDMTGLTIYHDATAGTPYWTDNTGNAINPGNPVGIGTQTGSSISERFNLSTAAFQGETQYNPDGTLRIDENAVSTTTTLNDLRTAEAVQKWLELNARGGSRYVEFLYSQFFVRSSDQRMQRPEYLGGARSKMQISEVLQTSQTDETAQGTMAGHGISVSGGGQFRYRCEEHGYIICILSVRPRTAYYQGLPKDFFKFNRVDYLTPLFTHLGEQPVLAKELWYDEDDDHNDDTFGYLPIYSEYRDLPSRVAGQMRATLEFWHMGRSFSARPVLNQAFIESNATKRIFAVEDPEEDCIVAHVYNVISSRRPLPLHGDPGLVI